MPLDALVERWAAFGKEARTAATTRAASEAFAALAEERDALHAYNRIDEQQAGARYCAHQFNRYEYILEALGLAAVASNKPGFHPVVVNGRPVKSINQFYNKRKAELQQKLGHPGATKRVERITNKRNRRIDHYLHTASKRIIALLVEERIGTLVIGKNDGWKQEVEMGKQNNQNFVQIPHARFIAMLTYKAELVGIKVLLTEESYTSQASFLDRDELPVYDPNHTEQPKFSGKCLKKPRGLYRASGKRYINADLKGACNIIYSQSSTQGLCRGCRGFCSSSCQDDPDEINKK